MTPVAWVWRLLIGATLLVPIAAVGAFFWLRSGVPPLEATTVIDGLSGPVQVIHDAHGVPHIFAATEEDALTALGYVHARDRIWQMDVQRRIGSGRISELIGERSLPFDQLMRTLGLRRRAEAAVAELPPVVRGRLDAYVRGVNAWIDNAPSPLPPEFVVGGYEPEAWSPTDTLVLGQLMALRLSGNYRDEVMRARLVDALGEDRTSALFPDEATPLWSIDQASRGAAIDAVERLAAALPEPLGPNGASNAWIVGGAHTATGAPILANDPHLGLDVPTTWYLARLETPDAVRAGATLPGAPYHIIGHNGGIAWGLTTTGADTQDLFIERVDPDNPDQYLTPDGPAPFDTRTETIDVADADPVTITIRETRHGPVLSDLGNEDIDGITPDGTVIAVAIAGFESNDTVAEALDALKPCVDGGRSLGGAGALAGADTERVDRRHRRAYRLGHAGADSDSGGGRRLTAGTGLGRQP